MQLVAREGGKRPAAFARQVATEAWQTLEASRWIAAAPNPPTYVRPTQHCVLRWLTEQGRLKYSTLLCSLLDWSMAEIVADYDDRGMCETEIQADKRGLCLEQRLKKQLYAQEALILLTDVAHNGRPPGPRIGRSRRPACPLWPIALDRRCFCHPRLYLRPHSSADRGPTEPSCIPMPVPWPKVCNALLAHFGHP